MADKIEPTTKTPAYKRLPFLTKATEIVLFVALIAGGIAYYVVRTKAAEREQELNATIAAFGVQVNDVSGQLAAAQAERDDWESKYRSERRKNSKFENQIDEISDTISVLDKLRQIDSELLKKYSKVSFLNENYLPQGLKTIDRTFVSGATAQQFLTKANPFLEDLFDAAKDDDIELRVVSAYRSFGTQAALKSQYAVVYGTGANQFSADQGYSEHQLGTTVDFTTPALNGAIDGFGATPAYQWLLKNAYRYGFVLSYPAGNAYYQFEPWHWRFVGVDLATDLYKDGKHFYDLEQREIDPYLVKIFD